MHFKIPFPLLPLLLALLLVPLAAPAHSAPRSTLSCTGPFARAASHAGIVKVFGAANVTSERVGVGEGEMERATVIFARDKARRLEIFWRDAKRRRGLAELRTVPGSRWRMPQGVALGQSLAEVETLNGKPFLLSGFGWDYGGTTTDWQGGALGKQDGGCRLMLRFEQRKTTDADIDGERDFSSDDKGMRSAEPAVEEISLRFE